MKTKCTKLAEELGVPPNELLERAKRILKPAQLKGGKNAHFTFFTEDGADLLRQADVAPLTVAKRYKAFCLHAARNPRWVFCKIEGMEGKHPVAIPRKLQGRLVRKSFVAEAIEDSDGVTYRHELLARFPR
jgi:hypothetical protein